MERSNRTGLIAGTLLAVSAASAATAVALAPQVAIRGTGSIDPAGGGKRRGAEAALVRHLEYEWAESFREDEPATVVLRFRDPACRRSQVQPTATRSTADAEFPGSEVVVTLATTGFAVRTAGDRKQIRLRPCDQSLSWDVLPVRAAEHRLSFSFETSDGDLEDAHRRFDVAVQGPLLLPSSVLQLGATTLSASSGLFGLFKIVTGLLKRLRALRSPATSAAGE
jgi:hypothetical protein